MRFISGRNNLAATIYVPYDCNNNCPFCTSKKEYEKINSDNLGKYITLINETPAIKDVVITGGEPFANLEYLQKLIDAISYSKNIFINTTLPAKSLVEALAIITMINRNKAKINCINVSRHLTVKTQNTLDEMLKVLEVPYRINSVLYGVDLTDDELPEKMQDFIKTYHDATSIHFRADYRKITMATLKNVDDPFIEFMTNKMGAVYLGGGGCQVCNNDDFEVKFGDEKYNISYHRGLEHSSLKVGNTIVVNDIVIKPDGKMYYDWDNKQSYGFLGSGVLDDLGTTTYFGCGGVVDAFEKAAKAMNGLAKATKKLKQAVETNYCSKISTYTGGCGGGGC